MRKLMLVTAVVLAIAPIATAAVAPATVRHRERRAIARYVHENQGTILGCWTQRQEFRCIALFIEYGETFYQHAPVTYIRGWQSLTFAARYRGGRIRVVIVGVGKPHHFKPIRLQLS